MQEFILKLNLFIIQINVHVGTHKFWVLNTAIGKLFSVCLKQLGYGTYFFNSKFYDSLNIDQVFPGKICILIEIHCKYKIVTKFGRVCIIKECKISH